MYSGFSVLSTIHSFLVMSYKAASAWRPCVFTPTSSSPPILSQRSNFTAYSCSHSDNPESHWQMAQATHSIFRKQGTLPCSTATHCASVSAGLTRILDFVTTQGDITCEGVVNVAPSGLHTSARWGGHVNSAMSNTLTVESTLPVACE
jgi:hypothetical protein